MNKYTLRLKRALKTFLRELRTDTDGSVPFAGDKHSCPVCNIGLAYFNPIDKEYLALIVDYEYNYPITQMETFNAAAYSCPNCGANDRERLFALYFQKRSAEFDAGKKLKMVDFAPSWGIAE